MTLRPTLLAVLLGLSAALRGAEEAAAAAPAPENAPPAAEAAAPEAAQPDEEAADDDPLRPEVSFDLNFLGKYIWRLMNYNSHPVLQPELYATVYGFTAGIWGVRDLTDDGRDATGNLTELDWVLSYGTELNLGGIGLEDTTLEFETGMWSYNYPNTITDTDPPREWPSTHELFIDLSIVPPGIGDYFTPGIELYYDIDDGRDALWVQPKITGGYELPKSDLPIFAEAVNWNLFMGFSNRAYGRYNFEDENGEVLNEAACVGGGVLLELPCKIKGVDFLTITPSAQLTTIWDSDARDMQDHPDNFVWGLKVGVAF